MINFSLSKLFRRQQKPVTLYDTVHTKRMCILYKVVLLVCLMFILLYIRLKLSQNETKSLDVYYMLLMKHVLQF